MSAADTEQSLATEPSPVPGISRNVFVLGLVSFAADISSEMLYPVLPIFLTATLGTPVSLVGVIEGIAEGTASVSKVPAGWISDRLPERRSLVAGGYALAALGKLLLALSFVWPQALLARVILASSRPDDLVLDPFCGTGTTGAVAKHLGRRFIGVEREQSYAKAAENRIAAVTPLQAPTLAPFMTAREAPRVPFTALIERGLVNPGARLVDAKKRHKALVRADGAVSLGEHVGSIHRIGALAQGLEACNGWTFWHFEVDGKLKPIDLLREQAKRQLGLNAPAFIPAE